MKRLILAGLIAVSLVGCGENYYIDDKIDSIYLHFVKMEQRYTRMTRDCNALNDLVKEVRIPDLCYEDVELEAPLERGE